MEDTNILKSDTPISYTDLAIIGSVINVERNGVPTLSLIIDWQNLRDGTFAMICASAQETDIEAFEVVVDSSFINEKAFKNRVLPSAASLSMAMSVRGILMTTPVVSLEDLKALGLAEDSNNLETDRDQSPGRDVDEALNPEVFEIPEPMSSDFSKHEVYIVED